MKTILKSTIVYRFEDLDQAVIFAEDTNGKTSDEYGNYSVTKYSIEHKTPKDDDFYVVTMIKDYTK